ncbi:unnamed protein product [Strongylus vulgaris]|uniref:Uncharacterized protein n=1 Tax=Strongylus vulgaris TaxID=40348 RepID=A0A3P7LN55_STRVU|nr:unnamed protein product [Strongylus vulgaris]
MRDSSYMVMSKHITAIRCNSFGDCHFDDKLNSKALYDCFCALPIRMCVRIDPSEGNFTDLCSKPAAQRIVKFWEILPSTTLSPV